MPFDRPRHAFADDERGGVAAFGIFLLIATLAVAGGMVDATNGWRNKTLLGAAADIGAHAGAVAIAKGATEAEVREIVEAVVRDNMPTDQFGNVLSGRSDIVFAHYDPHLEAFTGSTPVNALIVRAQRTEANGNPIRTFLLKLVGMPRLNAAAYSAAVFDVNGRCTSKEGIFAREKVTLTSQTDVGPGLCVHSEDFVWLPQQNVFRPGSMVTMPQMAKCQDKCTDKANPGIVAREAHMVLPDFAELIMGTYDDFLQSSFWPDRKTAFFEGIGMGDQQELVEKGIIAEEDAPLAKGTVVPMTPAQFHSVTELPAGLVYHVMCSDKGNGKSTILQFDDEAGIMRDAALMTNCSLEFQDGSQVIGSLVVTTRERTNATITAGSSVIVADPGFSCAESKRTTFMSMSKVSVPAEFVMSNVTMVVNADVDIASATSGALTSKGLGIYASGRVQVSSQHTFRACGNSDNVLVEDGKIVRIVPPPGSTSVSTAM